MATEHEPILKRPDIPGRAGILERTFVPLNAQFYKSWVAGSQALQELLRLQSVSVQPQQAEGTKPDPKILYIARHTSQELSPEDFWQMTGQNLDIYLLINLQHRKTYPSKAAKLIGYNVPLEEVHRFFTPEELEPNFQQWKNALKDHWGNILFAYSLISQTALDPETGQPINEVKLNEIANDKSANFDQITLKEAFRQLAEEGFFENLVSHGLKNPEEKEAYYKQISAWLLSLSSTEDTQKGLKIDLPFPLSIDAGEDKTDLEFLPHIAQMTFSFCQKNHKALTKDGAIRSIPQRLQNFYVRAIETYIGKALGNPAEAFKDSFPKLIAQDRKTAKKVFAVIQQINSIIDQFKSLSAQPRV